MRTQLSTGGRRRVPRTLGIAAAVTVCLLVAPAPASAAPTDAQISAAERARQDAAAEVGAITAQLAQAESAAAAASAAAQIALQDYEEAQAAYEQARADADAAAAEAARAVAALAQGEAEVAAFARASYIQGSTSSGTRALLSSGGPAQLLERAALLDAVGEHRTDVVAQLTVLQEQSAAADTVAQQTLGEADGLQQEAATLLAGAQQQEIAARAQAAALTEQQDAVEQQLSAAQQTLTGLQDDRAAAQAQAQVQAQRDAAARAAAAAPRSPAAPPASSGGSSSGGSSSGGSSSGGSSSRPAPVAAPAPPPVTTVGNPSRSTVETAIAAAMSQRGVPYSWGGGGSNGPSFGISPDTSVWGFDCSGLTQYAYAQAGIRIGGTSRDQYWLNRGKTVAKGDLQRGDLLFWDDGSANPNYLDIVHVAIYLGDGQMIEAPTSGSFVKVSTARTSSSTYFGAVRPAG
ncbi:C40 family peptidase [Modestobacter roseus]|uniref:Cell wall-associated NlpC family hydrolase n=1 Tax=Modestobacter roseus TaxID=1181884 RepID=A0A562IR03_9ACTN|nr:NlpC/P60 family protein [Modestobacter roseus]TWH73358.1 cell wall-associated NlpC family hydrolase [Modestobacter roseus]